MKPAAILFSLPSWWTRCLIWHSQRYYVESGRCSTTASVQLSVTGLENVPTFHAKLPNKHSLTHWKSKVEAAYRRGDSLDKRRNLMRDWAIFA